MYRTIPEPPPADAHKYKSLTYAIDHSYGRPMLKLWRGRATKPTLCSFRSLETLNQYLAKLVNDEDLREVAKQARKAAEEKQIEEMSAKLQVGTILHYSWGYDQTNAEFYQIVERKARTAIIRRIASEVEETTYMSGNARPIKDAFICGDPPLTKRITAYGIRMEFGTASPIVEGRSYHVSWYA